MDTEKITEAIQVIVALIAEKLREVLTDSQQRENTSIREEWLTGKSHQTDPQCLTHIAPL